MSRSFPKTQSQLFNLIFCNFAQISYILAVKCSKLNELQAIQKKAYALLHICQQDILYENITFYAEQKMIEVDGVRKKIPT